MVEVDGTGNVLAVNSFGANGLVSRHDASQSLSGFYRFDERGNVLDIGLGNPSVSTAGPNVYTAFGQLLSGVSFVHGFGGQWGYQTDQATGLVLATHRYYDPNTGRWLTRDPIGYQGGVNVYAYVNNNPINNIDPNGTDIQMDPSLRPQYEKAKAYIIKGNKQAKAVFDYLEKSKDFTVFLQLTSVAGWGFTERIAEYQPATDTMSWDPTVAYILPNGEGRISPAMILYHEVCHATGEKKDPSAYDSRVMDYDAVWFNMEEKRVISQYEQKAARLRGEGIRHSYMDRGTPIRVKSVTDRFGRK